MRISTAQIYQQGLSGVLRQQNTLNQTQLQLSTGRKINSPSDDPVGAARLQELERAVEVNDVYNRNVSRTRQRLQVEETAVASAGELIQRVRELTVQASNAPLSDGDKAQIAVELRQRLDQLVAIANTRDGDGEFIFAGAQAGSEPFVRTASGVDYVGDSIQRELSIGPGITMRDGDTGDKVFMAIRDGNGVVSASQNPANTGGGYIAVENAIDQSAYDGDTYTVEFLDAERFVVRDGLGNLVPGFDTLVPDPADPTPLTPSLPLVPEGVAYTAGDRISFAGVNVTVRGTPEAGDEFVIEPAANQSVFATLSDLIGALEGSSGTTADAALQRQGIDDALARLDRIETRFLEVRSDIGGRLNTL
ncbi:MAG: flagellar hook-associated protein FlgL, partial [Wenzhouxiangella sp.]|nr:flagellar hook-associated protein FlgL [Wenzhouxiangella sp.]